MLDTYRNQGVLVVRGFFDPATLTPVTEALEAFAESSRARPENLRCRYQPDPKARLVLDAIDPVLDVVPAVAAIASEERLLKLLRTLLGDEPVLFKDKAHFRRPGVKGYPVHQDYIAWEGFPATFTTVLVALDDADLSSGCLEAWIGQHRRGYLSPKDGNFHDLSPASLPAESHRRLELARGDIAVFGAFLPHGSGPNRSEKPRRHLYLSYNARFDGGDQRDTHYAQYRQWLEARYREFGDSTASFD